MATGIILILIAVMALLIIWRRRADWKFRESLLRHGQRMGDAEYLEAMALPPGGGDARLALRLRDVFAKIGRLPRECVLPDLPLFGVFRAQCFFFFDGIDLAELVMEVEDELGVEIPEANNGPPIDDDDTVATCTVKIIDYGRLHWKEVFAV